MKRFKELITSQPDGYGSHRPSNLSNTIYISVSQRVKDNKYIELKGRYVRKVRIWTGTGYFPFKICLQVRMEEGCGLWIYLETETLGNELSRNVSLHLSDRKLNCTSSHSVNFDNIYGLFQTTFGKHGSLQNKRPIFLPFLFFRVFN